MQIIIIPFSTNIKKRDIFFPTRGIFVLPVANIHNKHVVDVCPHASDYGGISTV